MDTKKIIFGLVRVLCFGYISHLVYAGSFGSKNYQRELGIAERGQLYP